VFVAGNQVGAVEARQQSLALGGLAGLAALDFEDFDRRQPERPSTRARPPAIVAGQRRFGRASQLADTDQGDAHRRKGGG
jgi:hypothetical protein